MSRGIVVDHKDSGVRYAVSEANYNSKIHKKVRDLKPGETVQGFRPLRREALGEEASTSATPTQARDLSTDQETERKDTSATPKTTSK